MKRLWKYFSAGEKLLWFVSVIAVTVSFAVFDRENYLNLSASLIGVTSLIFIAKGNPAGQILSVVFSALYGAISYFCAYYGEMITYLGMTAPMAIAAVIVWLKNPYKGKRTEVKVNKTGKKDWILLTIFTVAVTVAFYFILKTLGTANLIVSTVSVATSFAAVFLTFRRSPFYAVFYALNDLVLIVLWSLAAVNDLSYISVIACFAAFFINDIYGFLNWRRMAKRQKE